MRLQPNASALSGFLLATGLFAPAALLPILKTADVESFPVRGVAVEKEVRVPVPPAEAFEAFTGDVSGWWDHRFSAEPARFEIEPRPGGAFRELFDGTGTAGVIHAEVTWCQPGERLVFRGPLGFHGQAVDMVHSFQFEADGDGTVVRASIRGLGEFDDEGAAAVDAVWDHFLGKFAAYVERAGQ